MRTDATLKAIQTRGISKQFGSGADRVLALDNVSVDINENEFFTLLGPSGCGKTTLLRLIAGFESPTSGEIDLYGERIGHLPPYKRPVNTVFQSYALFPHMTVSQNISFGLEMLGKPASEIADTTTRMLQLVQMQELADRRTSQISGGQQQRVALARALAPHPKVLLLDEPLSALDFKLRKDMQLELKRLQSETGITFVFVTHDQEEALTMSDRIAVMNHGRIRQTGTPRDIYDHPAERFVADFIGDSNFLRARVNAKSGDQLELELGGGYRIRVAGRENDARDEVNVVVRPEHAQLGSPEQPGLPGTLQQTVYSGTDTRYHIALGSGESFVVRRQNSPDAPAMPDNGAAVSVLLNPATLQVLDD
jgi:spermidine/putrescine transport system ATP-binding protein